ncbi:MAG: FMN-binding protein [Oscillospiraceae bacterium]
MKIQPKFVLRIAGTLLGISLVVAGLLGAVNGVTAERIAAINAENTAAAMNQVVTVEDAEYVPVEVSEDMTAAAAAYGALDSVYEVRAGGELVGYTVKVIASGSQGSIEMMVGTDTALAVTGVAIVDNSETSGIGSKVMNNVNGVLDQFKGMSGAGSLVVGQNVDAISGATVSSKGVTAGVNAALAAVEALG